MSHDNEGAGASLRICVRADGLRTAYRLRSDPSAANHAGQRGSVTCKQVGRGIVSYGLRKSIYEGIAKAAVSPHASVVRARINQDLCRIDF